MNFVLLLDQGGKQKGVHHDKLKPYEGDNPPAWLKGRTGSFFSNFSMLLINCKYDKEINNIDFIQALFFVESLFWFSENAEYY